MKTRRIIRFEDDFVENIEQKNPESQAVIIESYNKAYNNLRVCVKRILTRKTVHSDIAVFGKNSEVLINDFCNNLRELNDNVIFIGQADCSEIDVYNSIILTITNYIINNFTNSRQYRDDIRDDFGMVSDKYACNNCYRAIKKDVVEIMEDLGNAFGCDKISNGSEHLSQAIRKTKELARYLKKYGEGNKLLLIAIKMKELDYDTIDMIESLYGGLITIIFSSYDLRNGYDRNKLAGIPVIKL